MRKKLNYINMFSKRSFTGYSAFLKRKLHLRNRNKLSIHVNSSKCLFYDSFYSRRDFFFKIFLSKYVFVKLFTLKESTIKDKYSFISQSTISKITSNTKNISYFYSYDCFFLTLHLTYLISLYKLIHILLIKNYF